MKTLELCKFASAAALALACGAALAGNGPSAQPGAVVPKASAASAWNVLSAISYSPTSHTVRATIAVTGDTDDDGNGNDAVCGVIWDDGDAMTYRCVNVPVGSTQTLRFTFNWTGPISQTNPGVGLYLEDVTSISWTPSDPFTTLTLIDPLHPTAVAAVPTLSGAGLAMLGAGLGFMGWRRQRGRKGQARPH